MNTIPTIRVIPTATSEPSRRASERPRRNGKIEAGVTTTYFIIRYRSRSSRIAVTSPAITPYTTFHSALPTIMN